MMSNGVLDDNGAEKNPVLAQAATEEVGANETVGHLSSETVLPITSNVTAVYVTEPLFPGGGFNGIALNGTGDSCTQVDESKSDHIVDGTHEDIKDHMITSQQRLEEQGVHSVNEKQEVVSDNAYDGDLAEFDGVNASSTYTVEQGGDTSGSQTRLVFSNAISLSNMANTAFDSENSIAVVPADANGCQIQVQQTGIATGTSEPLTTSPISVQVADLTHSNLLHFQASTAQPSSQMIFLQMPQGSQVGNQMVVLPSNQIQQLQPSLGPITLASGSSSDVSTMQPKKKGRGRSKSVNRDILKAKGPLRPLAPRILAVPLPGPVLVTSHGPPRGQVLPFNHLSGPVTDNGQYFEVLGRCISCFRFSRTTTYCRAEKGHREVKATACLECESKGYSTVVCRRKYNHKAPNAHSPNVVINTAVQRHEDVKDTCLRHQLPACFAELHSVMLHHADIIFAQSKLKEDLSESLLSLPNVQIPNQCVARKPTDYARGYLYPYSKESWEQWLLKFCLQTGTSYRIRTGKRVNKRTDHGLANHNGKIVVYRALESQLYNCALGGKPRKKKLRDGARRRRERGSKLIGCYAVIHTRLLETEQGWRALEITVPKQSAHLPAHDPRNNSTDLSLDINDILFSSQVTSGHLNRDNNQTLDLIEVLQENTDDQQSAELNNSNQIDVTRKQVKSLLLNCSGLIDNVHSLDILKALHEHTQMLYNQIFKSGPLHKRVKRRKRTLHDASLTDENEEHLETFETNAYS